MNRIIRSELRWLPLVLCLSSLIADGASFPAHLAGLAVRAAQGPMMPAFSWIHCTSGRNEIWLTYDEDYSTQPPRVLAAFRSRFGGGQRTFDVDTLGYTAETWPVGRISGREGSDRATLQITRCPAPEVRESDKHFSGCSATYHESGTPPISVPVTCEARLAPSR